MVHLTSVPSDATARQGSLADGLEKIRFDDPAEDEGVASIYGSRFAAQELPQHEMPDHEMPKEVAYRLIRDDLTLDGNPMLNLASFVTTYMVCRPTVPYCTVLDLVAGGRG